MLLTIVTIVRNDKSGFLTTKKSIQKQTFFEYEWIVIDGASTDGTVDEIANIAQPNFRYLSEQDKGIYDAMNKGLNLAQGEYITFLNAGDYFPDETTLSTLSVYLAKNYDFIYGDFYEEYENNQLNHKSARSLTYLWYGMPTSHQAMYFNRSMLASINFNTSYKIAGDYDFTCRFIKQSQNWHRVQLPLCVFNKTGLSEKYASKGRWENHIVRTTSLKIGVIPSYLILFINWIAFTVKTIERLTRAS